MNGRMIQMTEGEKNIKERIPTAVKTSVPTTMGMIPSRSAKTPQTNFPTAPPAKIRVKAKLT
jgi:hypothetical protein